MLRRFLCACIIISFVSTSLAPVPKAHADGPLLGLPQPGTMVSLSPAYEPVLIKGLKVHPENPFLFDFILDAGASAQKGRVWNPPLREESARLIKYFLASLTIPEKDLWVNLSPYEKDRIIAPNLGQTEMGRDMLAQDYILKQLTASLIYPEQHLGKTFWDEVYAKAQEQFGTAKIPVNTFNKVWIVADKADVFERGNVAYVVAAHLKVMLEEDYMALSHHVIPSSANSHSIASQIIKEIILPQIEKEVNMGKNFAPLRQMFYSMVLASWYKRALKNAILTQIYGNQSKVKVGINQADPNVNEEIFQRYLRAYKKGVFNYIKEDIDQTGKESSPKKYFSGGLAVRTDLAMRVVKTFDPALLEQAGHEFFVERTALRPDTAMLTMEDARKFLESQPSEYISGIISTMLETLLKPKIVKFPNPGFAKGDKIYGLAVAPNQPEKQFYDVVSALVRLFGLSFRLEGKFLVMYDSKQGADYDEKLEGPIRANFLFWLRGRSNQAMTVVKHKMNDNTYLYTISKGKKRVLVLGQDRKTLEEALNDKPVLKREIVFTLSQFYQQALKHKDLLEKALLEYEHDPDQLERINEDWNSLFRNGRIIRFGYPRPILTLMRHGSFEIFLSEVEKDPGILNAYLKEITNLKRDEGKGQTRYKALLLYTAKMLGVNVPKKQASESLEITLENGLVYFTSDRRNGYPQSLVTKMIEEWERRVTYREDDLEHFWIKYSHDRLIAADYFRKIFYGLKANAPFKFKQSRTLNEMEKWWFDRKEEGALKHWLEDMKNLVKPGASRAGYMGLNQAASVPAALIGSDFKMTLSLENSNKFNISRTSVDELTVSDGNGQPWGTVTYEKGLIIKDKSNEEISISWDAEGIKVTNRKFPYLVYRLDAAMGSNAQKKLTMRAASDNRVARLPLLTLDMDFETAFAVFAGQVWSQIPDNTRSFTPYLLEQELQVYILGKSNSPRGELELFTNKVLDYLFTIHDKLDLPSQKTFVSNIIHWLCPDIHMKNLNRAVNKTLMRIQEVHATKTDQFDELVMYSMAGAYINDRELIIPQAFAARLKHKLSDLITSSVDLLEPTPAQLQHITDRADFTYLLQSRPDFTYHRYALKGVFGKVLGFQVTNTEGVRTYYLLVENGHPIVIKANADSAMARNANHGASTQFEKGSIVANIHQLIKTGEFPPEKARVLIKLIEGYTASARISEEAPTVMKELQYPKFIQDTVSRLPASVIIVNDFVMEKIEKELKLAPYGLKALAPDAQESIIAGHEVALAYHGSNTAYPRGFIIARERLMGMLSDLLEKNSRLLRVFMWALKGETDEKIGRQAMQRIVGRKDGLVTEQRVLRVIGSLESEASSVNPYLMSAIRHVLNGYGEYLAAPEAVYPRGVPRPAHPSPIPPNEAILISDFILSGGSKEARFQIGHLKAWIADLLEMDAPLARRFMDEFLRVPENQRLQDARNRLEKMLRGRPVDSLIEQLLQVGAYKISMNRQLSINESVGLRWYMEDGKIGRLGSLDELSSHKEKGEITFWWQEEGELRKFTVTRINLIYLLADIGERNINALRRFLKELTNPAMIGQRGGIDLTRSQMRVRKEGQGVEMQFDPAMVARIRRDGFDGLDFEIQSITRVINLPLFLGLN